MSDPLSVFFSETIKARMQLTAMIPELCEVQNAVARESGLSHIKRQTDALDALLAKALDASKESV